MVIALIIIIAIALIVYAKIKFTKPKHTNHKGLTLILIAFLTIVAYVILFKFPPFDAAGNIASAAALLAPKRHTSLMYEIHT